MLLFRKSFLALISAPALLLAACGGPSAQQGQGGAYAPEVSIETIRAESVTLSATLPGRTNAFRVAEIRPQVSGVIAERLFTEGGEVKAGAPLYQIDKAPYEAAYNSAVAALARAEALAVAAANKEKRFAELVKSKAVSQQDYDDAVAAAKQALADIGSARAARDSAKIDLDRTTITSPIDGRIGRTLVTVGALVTANQANALAVVNQLDPIYVDVTQSSAEILRLKRKLASGELQTVDGDKLSVALTLEDGGEYDEKGSLELTEMSVEPSTGSVTMRALFPNKGELLLPGMFVRARIIEAVRDEAILVAQRAVMRTPAGEAYVFVVNAENKAEQRLIVAERMVGDKWLVADGLAPGDRVIIEGFQRFRAGDAVTPVDSSLIAETTQSGVANTSSGGGAR